MGGTYEEQVTDPANRRMREASGEVDSDSAAVALLYLLARDHLPIGELEAIVRQVSLGGPYQFTNGHLARWAEDAAGRLLDA